MIHAEQPIMDVERRIDVDVDLTPIVEEYVFPESPNQVQREEVAETLVVETVTDVVETLVVETVTNVAETSAAETVTDVAETSVVEPVTDVAETVTDVAETSVVEPVTDVAETSVAADVLEPILTKPTPINRHRKPWSASEIARLYREYQINRYTVDEIAEMHGRTYFAIVGKLKSENILYDVSDEEDEYLEDYESSDDESSDDDSRGDYDGVQSIKYPNAFLDFALAYCKAVEFVVDSVFAGVRYVYRTFAPLETTAGQNKRKYIKRGR